MRSLLALLALGLSVGAAAACDMHSSHTAVLASAASRVAPMPQASAAVTALPRSTMVVEDAALAMSTAEPAAAPYCRGCSNARQKTVYLTH
jgi:hypothetical protein